MADVIEYYQEFLTIEEIAACTGLSVRYVKWILEQYLGHPLTD